ncbi:MAG: hypothetical protein J1F64_04205 [Oscillospiraceae bacterium]|nr:hypothetical protein [Oscillospiraceae bacterium]
MSEKDLLELLVKKVDGMSQEFQEVKQEVRTVKQEIQEVKQEFQEVKQEFRTVKQEFQEVKQEVRTVKQELQEVKQEVRTVKQEVRQNSIAIETTVENCLKAYADGIIANREKMDSLNIDSINDKMNYMNLRQQYFDEELKRLKLKIG